MSIIIPISFSLLITFTFYSVLNEKQASSSFFQHIVADILHYSSLTTACFINQRSMYFRKINFTILYVIYIDSTSCTVILSTDDRRNMYITGSCPFFIMALIWICGTSLIPRLLLGVLTIFIVWLLARWCDSFHMWYSVDVFTIYFLVWQFIYLMFQWCYHQLSWPFLIFYQVSICILTAIAAFLFYDLVFRYFPSIILVIIWFACFYDM